jgi:hypothetical protein
MPASDPTRLLRSAWMLDSAGRQRRHQRLRVHRRGQLLQLRDQLVDLARHRGDGRAGVGDAAGQLGLQGGGGRAHGVHHAGQRLR